MYKSLSNETLTACFFFTIGFPVGNAHVLSGSFETRDSFRNMRIAQTPEEKKKVIAQRSGPSSRNTVITVAGLFTVGLMFISSGNDEDLLM